MTVTPPDKNIEVILVRNAYKSYRKTFGKSRPVLQGLNLTLFQGTIYGLLGPSGCGKTTLLRCILGCMQLDRGSIQVFGHCPGTKKSGIPGPRVGFMPQDDALLEQFTIAQNLNYYGCITQMTSGDLANRSAFLSKFLHLPPLNHAIDQLSGGEKKRVSFATALLHSPELIILDEPTVGVDPILRQRIWDYLFSMVNDGKATVIITTHYIEEARKSNMVGLMLDGRLLAEKAPELLITEMGCSTLEEAFLNLCCSKKPTSYNGQCDSQVPLNGKGMPISHSTVSQWTYHIPEDSETDSNDGNCKETKDFWFHARQMTREISQTMVIPKYSGLKAAFLKIYFRLKGDPIATMFEVFLPAILMICACLTLGKPLREIPLSVVNEDFGSLGQEFTSFIDSKVISQMPTSNYSSAYQDVLNGYSIGIMHIQPNFSDAILKRYQLAVLASSETINSSIISLSMDLTNVQASLSIIEHIMKTFDIFANCTLQELGIHNLLTSIPVVFHQPIYGKPNAEYADVFIPGIHTLLVYFFILGMTTIYFISDRLSGRLERDFICGLRTFEIILGYMAMGILISIFHVVSTMCIFIFLFSIPCEGSLFLLFLLGIGNGICGIANGMFIAAVCDKEDASIMLGLGTFSISVVICGIVWPLEGMHPLLRFISQVLLPQTSTVDAIRMVLGRGWTLAYKPVYLSIIIMSGWTTFFLIFSSIIYRLKS